MSKMMPLVFAIGSTLGHGSALSLGATGDFPASASCSHCVVVALDLDPSQPGFQTQLQVEPGTTVVEGVSVWVYDPANQSAQIHGVGYFGGLNRGIAVGHQPDGTNTGELLSISATSIAPVVPGHAASVSYSGIEKMFAGPELQFFETGTMGTIPPLPTAPILVMDLELSNATAGDRFVIHVGDMTATWRAQWPTPAGGAFSAAGNNTLDTGGDAGPDGTPSNYGVDSDAPVAVPPAIFAVDYVDGGGAVIQVGPEIPALGPWGLLALLLVLLVTAQLLFGRVLFRSEPKGHA